MLSAVPIISGGEGGGGVDVCRGKPTCFGFILDWFG